jgi:hypothetical protein
MINKITVLFYHVTEKGFPGEECPPEGGVTGIFMPAAKTDIHFFKGKMEKRPGEKIKEPFRSM